MGSVIQAAAGCLCPENALLDAVMDYISLREGEAILMDTQAGAGPGVQAGGHTDGARFQRLARLPGIRRNFPGNSTSPTCAWQSTRCAVARMWRN